MPRRVELDPTTALLAGALVLGLVIQLALPQVSPLADLSPATSGGRQARAVRLQTDGAGPRIVAAPGYPAILNRPLFSPSRSGTATVAADVAPVGALALLGVASDGGRASATFAAVGGAPRSLRLGEAMQGWRLSGVGRDHAILSRGEVLQVLKVGEPPQASISAPVAAPVGAAASAGAPAR